MANTSPSPMGTMMASPMAGSDMPSPMAGSGMASPMAGSGMASPLPGSSGMSMDPATMSPGSMSSGSMDPGSMDMGNSGMAGMAMGPDLLPPWVTWVWLVAMAAVLVLHCLHFVRMGGQHRWFHASHILMIVSMIYMYAGMEYKWKWFPHPLWAAVFVASSLAIAGWCGLRLGRRQSFSALWLLALLMQVAMVYMWLPNWWAPLTWLLVAYFVVEAVGWLAGWLDDSQGRLRVGGQTPGFVALAHPGARANASMAIMAASMSYMFAAMQVM